MNYERGLVFNTVIYVVEESRRKVDDFSVRRNSDIKDFKYQKALNKWCYKILQFNFTRPQLTASLLQSVEECLQGKAFTKSGNRFIITQCPIAEIEITAEYLKLVMDPDKATDYSK